MRLASGPAARTSTPVYHFPFGTENLFAREFGVDRSPERLLAAIERFHVETVDVGVANGRPFLLMASLGYDAEVIHDLASRRRGGISHLSYVPPIVRQILRWQPPPVDVRVDGTMIVEQGRGMVVVANSRQYARRLDPARRASMTDGRLDVVFLPMESRLDVIRWMILCRRGRHLDDPRVVYREGTAVEVRPATPQRFQIDGDPPEALPGEPVETAFAELRVSLRPAYLPVLIP